MGYSFPQIPTQTESLLPQKGELLAGRRSRDRAEICSQRPSRSVTVSICEAPSSSNLAVNGPATVAFG